MSIVEPKRSTRANLPEVLIEPEHGWVALKPARAVGVPRAAVLPDLARREGALQADRAGRGLGRSSSRFFTMVVFSIFFGELAKCPRTACLTRSSATPRWCPGRFSPTACRIVDQPVVKRQPDHQGLLPAADHPASAVLSGVIDFVLAFVVLLGMMVFYGICPHAQRGLAAALFAAGAGHFAGRRPVALGAERAVPRRAVHRARF